jgi:Xaa-Pro aminopeptidase
MKREEFARRRRQLMRMMGKDGIAILPAAPVRRRNGDVEYPYRQDSDFQFLTGFGEPEAVAVLMPHRPQGEYVLFCRDRDPTRELWDGPRAGPEGAVRDFGADDAFPIDDLDEILPGLLESRSRVFHTMGLHPEFDQRAARSGQEGLAHAAGVRRAGPPPARYASVQECGRAWRDASIGADRRDRA